MLAGLGHLKKCQQGFLDAFTRLILQSDKKNLILSRYSRSVNKGVKSLDDDSETFEAIYNTEIDRKSCSVWQTKQN